MQDLQKNAKPTDESKLYRQLQDIQTNAKGTDVCKIKRLLKESFLSELTAGILNLSHIELSSLISICCYVSKLSLLLALPILFIGNFPETPQSSSHPNNNTQVKIDSNNVHIPTLIFFLNFFPNRFLYRSVIFFHSFLSPLSK